MSDGSFGRSEFEGEPREFEGYAAGYDGEPGQFDDGVGFFESGTSGFEAAGIPKKQVSVKKRLLLVAVLMLITAGLVVFVTRGQHPSGSSEPGAVPVSVPEPVAPSDAEESESGSPVPVRLRIPSIGVDQSIDALGLNPDETVEVPRDFRKPGWYKLGPSPGQPGSAVILGHLDSFAGPAIFFRLPELRAGEQVEVILSDGRTAQFSVTRVETYPKAEFPAEEVYGSHGSGTLQLVTCGGVFDTETRSYQSNIVAYTTLTGVTPAADTGAK
ncbi:class F sortase [Nocardia fluminea]|uniref:class F sortase n=1 Tax=Nocardia fluminea TaxID=134984 RepID=UPI00365BE160